ncbi:hypothetical protein HanPI659440_Chr01g0023181 [Helianthus annuus]|nr:hypothetical protein HanPI659440_Chr01g0023181 [Helianthus annuus]
MIQFLFCWFIIDHPISFFRIQKRERERKRYLELEREKRSYKRRERTVMPAVRVQAVKPTFHFFWSGESGEQILEVFRVYVEHIIMGYGSCCYDGDRHCKLRSKN